MNIFVEKLRLLSGTLAKPEISKIKSIRPRWPIVDHGKFQFLQGCRSLSHIWTTKVMLKVMVSRQKININFEFLYCYGRIGLVTSVGNKKIRSVFMHPKNPVGHKVFEDFPLTQQMEGSTSTPFWGIKNNTFSAEMCWFGRFDTARMIFTWFVTTKYSKKYKILDVLVAGNHFKLVKIE